MHPMYYLEVYFWELLGHVSGGGRSQVFPGRFMLGLIALVLKGFEESQMLNIQFTPL